jgi:hypothetical protein
MLRTKSWRSDVRVNKGQRVANFGDGRSAVFGNRISELCRQLAETGEHLGLERVGLVVEAGR